MPYVVIEDFRAGLDRRKNAAASPPGSLQNISNAHITRGGEIEKRKAFVAKYSVPSTFGFTGANGVLYVFGSGSNPGVPAGVTYQQLVHPSAIAMSGIVATEFFDGKIAAGAGYVNGDVLTFYDGSRITDWDSGSGQTVAAKKVAGFLTLDSKLYGITESLLVSSAIDAPTDWHGTGSGFKNMANQSAGSETLTGLGRYQELAAIFARRNTQIWALDPDWALNAKRQDLPGVGTFAPKSIEPYGDIDLFFLADTGIRSLRARAATNQAGVSDVGTPIDDEILAYMATLSDAQKAAACGVIDPIDGRYMLALGNRVYLFSYYPTSKISAWARYDLDFTITDWVSTDGRVWARGGNSIYLLGGDSGQEYDSSTVEVDLPYIDGRAIATWKEFTGIDIVCEGEWTIFVNTDPNQPDEESEVAIVNKTTLTMDQLGIVGDSPVIKLRLVNNRAGPAKLSKIIIEYNVADAG